MKKITPTLIILTLLLSVFPTSVNAAWYDTNFTYCRKMTMTAGGNSGGAATTTTAGYALLATSTIADLKYSTFGGKVQTMDTLNSATSSPLDVIFTSGTDCNSDGGSLLPFSFESYASTTGAFVAWIRPSDISSTTAKTILMYYGKASATNQTNETGIWDSTYKGVWHLPNGTTLTGYDSTSNNHDNASAVSLTASTAQIDGGGTWNGTTSRLGFSSPAGLDDVRPITGSVWIYETGDGEGGVGYIMAKVPTSSIDGPRFFTQTNQTISFGAHSTGAADFPNRFSATTYSRNVWQHLVFTWDGSLTATNIKFFINGAEVTYGSGTNGATAIVSDASNNFIIGNRAGDDRTFTGSIDEPRIRSVAAHAMDIKTDYNNQVDSTTFWTIGAEETQTVVAPTGVGKKVIIRGSRIIIIGGRILLP